MLHSDTCGPTNVKQCRDKEENFTQELEKTDGQEGISDPCHCRLMRSREKIHSVILGEQLELDLMLGPGDSSGSSKVWR